MHQRHQGQPPKTRSASITTSMRRNDRASTSVLRQGPSGAQGICRRCLVSGGRPRTRGIGGCS
eukprot:986585-Pyramimonas_sp.AAC.1